MRFEYDNFQEAFLVRPCARDRDSSHAFTESLRSLYHRCVAQEPGWYDHDCPRWGGHTSTVTFQRLHSCSARRLLSLGRSSHDATGLRPFAFPWPDRTGPKRCSGSVWTDFRAGQISLAPVGRGGSFSEGIR